MREFLIRDAVITDCEEIFLVDNEYEYEKYSLASIRESLLSKSNVNIVAVIDEKIVGYISASFVFDEAELLKIVVLKKYRGNGIGKGLLRELFSRLKSFGVGCVFLEVRKNNISARELYEKFGFKNIHERKEYYDGDDAEVYKIELRK